MHRDPEVRRLILEIVMLRKSLQKVMDWRESCDRVAQDKGELPGPAWAVSPAAASIARRDAANRDVLARNLRQRVGAALSLLAGDSGIVS
ncbi:hypothetical protein [Burkholderia ubonensis]|uniref:hypothetical protein n=1 Tax=Burkholderia ubonensis TaxID=101571 RepID=UPI001E61EDFA|nr:hypothetical protein [Burkholderia ubonensis]